ncbi:MAG: murein biosynthesis integral membrane protein MurJ [Clostridia bacterium]|nr:murein biosynthesis integral membrane protein MurJ [Clostridia bacterium]
MDKSVGSKVIKSTAIILIISLIAKASSFLYESVLAYFVGTSMQADAYQTISGVQAAVYPMLSIGIWKVFMPLYKKHLSRGETDNAESLANKSITFFTLISFAAVILIIISAPALVSLVAPGFDGEAKAICVRLIRISAPMYSFILAASVIAAMLQSHEKFLGSQIREVISHIPPILIAILFYKKLGPDRGINALAVSLVVAAVCRILIELPFINWGYKFKPDINFRNKEFKLMLSRMPSALMSAGLSQINAIVDKSMASMLETGTVASMNYANKLFLVFNGLLSTPIATALYPQMIEYISLNKKDELKNLTVKMIGIFCVIMIPISIACWLFRQELIAVVYERGKFTMESTMMTKNIFGFYCICIVFSACSHVVSNIFYGYGDTKKPLIIGIVSLALNIVLNLVFIRFWGAGGLALSTSIAEIIVFVLHCIFVRKYVSIDYKKILWTASKVLTAAVIACLVPRFLFGDSAVFGTVYQDGWHHIFHINRYALLVASAAIGIPIYLVLIKLFKVSELKDLMNIVLTKVLKKRKPKNAA